MNRVTGNECAQCGADIIAPEWSGHLSDYCIRHMWSCDACGYQFEDTACLSAREEADASWTPSNSRGLAIFAAIRRA